MSLCRSHSLEGSRRGWPLAVAGLLLSLCLPLHAQGPRVTIRMRPFTTPIVLDTLARAQEYPAGSAAALAAAMEVFEALDVPVTSGDSARGFIANLRLVRSGSVGKLRMSRIVNCGAGLMGPNADQGRVTLAIAAFVDPLGEGRSRVGFAVTGSSIDLSGASIDPDACESTGYLETQMARQLQGRLLLNTPPG